METVYSLTKGGINAFTKALSKELAPNHIPVNAAVFGAVDTDMNAWLSKEEREELCREIPYGRMADTKEAAEFLRLLSMAPPYMTGQLIAFDCAFDLFLRLNQSVGIFLSLIDDIDLSAVPVLEDEEAVSDELHLQAGLLRSHGL